MAAGRGRDRDVELLIEPVEDTHRLPVGRGQRPETRSQKAEDEGEFLHDKSIT